uniref:60S ribosomal protein L18a-like protein n=1 Tax=Noccaea caerulescens TaxID=107243 RepID=A0A1J3ESF7_NOCCA
MNENIEEEKKGKYSLIGDANEEDSDSDSDSELGLFYKPLPCFGCGIGWFSFLLGFVFPFAWYFATYLYFTNCYRRDPRERSGLAASAIAALIFTVALVITVLVLVFSGR